MRYPWEQIRIFIKIIVMTERDSHILRNRPEIVKAKVTDNMSADERVSERYVKTDYQVSKSVDSGHVQYVHSQI